MSTSTGILTFAYGLEYQKQAHCLAVTAGANLDLPVSVITDRVLYEPLTRSANIIIDERKHAKWACEAHALDLTPYDVTFKTDADLLFPAGSYVYHPEHLPFTSGVATDIFDVPTTSTAFREVETEMGLPQVYSALFSFDRRTPEAQDFFAEIKSMLQRWYGMRWWDYAPKRLPPTTDTLYSMAHMHVLGPARLDGNQFVHCKPYINNWTHDDWVANKRFSVDNKCRMYLDGARISSPFHYYDKSLITDSFIQRLQDVCAFQA